jgi:hypothetical protein
VDKTIRTYLDNIRSDDGQIQFKSYNYLMKETEQPVDWAYEAWDEIVEGLTHKDNHIRAITSQILTHLAKSDPKGRIFKDFDKLLVSAHQIPQLVVELVETQRQPSTPPPVCSFLGGVCQSNGKSRSVTWFGLVQV